MKNTENVFSFLFHFFFVITTHLFLVGGVFVCRSQARIAIRYPTNAIHDKIATSQSPAAATETVTKITRPGRRTLATVS